MMQLPNGEKTAETKSSKRLQPITTRFKQNEGKAIVLQRADPWIYKHVDGWYYFTATEPDYNYIELRRSQTIVGLADAEPVAIWHKHESGEMSEKIWAPEIHFIDGRWYIYFASGRTDAGFAHRTYVLENESANPLEGAWTEKGKIVMNWESFNLDATTFEHKGERYLVWAQNDPAIKGNTNLYIAAMENPWTIRGTQIMIATPEYDWEKIGYLVNEGPAVIKRGGSLFISYSASATDFNYCVGLLTASEDSDLLDAASWTKSPEPVFKTDEGRDQYGPGHNGFTVAEDGETDVFVYHARTYKEIEGDPLNDPNRHTFVKQLHWSEDGKPDFKVWNEGWTR